MGCVCHTHTSVRLYRLQRFVSHYVLQSNKELEMTINTGCIHLVAHDSDGLLISDYLIKHVAEIKEYARFSYCPRCGKEIDWTE